MTDRELIRRIQNGDREALGSLIERYYDDVYRFCLYLTANEADSCDISQEVFFRFIRRADRYQYKNLKGYLLITARNLCRDYLRKKEREKRVELPVQDYQTLCDMAKASGKLQAENRSLRMQLQQSAVREQESRQRLRRCEEQLDAVLTETRPYREAMRVAPEQVRAFMLGICRRQQEEKRLNRQQRRQRAKGQNR